MEVNYYKKLVVRDFGSAPKLSTSKVDVLLVTQIPNIFNLLLYPITYYSIYPLSCQVFFYTSFSIYFLYVSDDIKSPFYWDFQVHKARRYVVCQMNYLFYNL